MIKMRGKFRRYGCICCYLGVHVNRLIAHFKKYRAPLPLLTRATPHALQQYTASSTNG